MRPGRLRSLLDDRWFDIRRCAILRLAVGDSLHLPMARVDALLPAKIDASTRSPRNIEISAKIPLRDLLRQCEGTNWIGLCWTILDAAIGTLVLMALPWTGRWWLRVGHQSLQPSGASLARTAAAGLIFDVGYSRRSHRHSPRYPPVVRAEAAPIPLAASARS
jgi:hypothetical protein